MNSTDTHAPQVDAFLAEVRRALDDLPAGVVDELVDGLAADLAEAQAERGEPLDRVVGTPEAYASELRAAAGLPPRTEPPRAAPRPSLSRRLADAVAPLAQVPAVRPLWRLVVDLRPAWWVLRAYFAVALLLTVVAPDPLRYFPILMAGHGVGGALLAGTLTVLAVAGSVWLGRQPLSGGLRVLVIAANLFALYVGYGVILEGARPRLVHAAVVPAAVDPGLMGVTNLYPFSLEGELLEDVLLYDQHGEPLSVDQLDVLDRDGQEVLREPLPTDVLGQPIPQPLPAPAGAHRRVGRQPPPRGAAPTCAPRDPRRHRAVDPHTAALGKARSQALGEDCRVRLGGAAGVAPFGQVVVEA